MSVDLRQQLQASLGETYRLERELGGGGMSRVFLAVEAALDRKVVVKVLTPELAAGVSVERFRREIYLAAQLQHPHIVPLLAAGDAAGLPWFTMPYVSGESLRARLIRDGELPVAESIRILRDVASALAYAHTQGVVHRDIKPDNVLLSHGVAVVTDFGVAKALTISSAETALARGGLTSMGVSLGTPAYMAPEQASADPGMDHRVDVYAFGITAYEMLTGQPPFAGRSPQAILGAHVAALPEPVSARRPGLPPLLGVLVMKCLEKRPADRPQTAGELIAALDMMTTPSSGSVPVPTPTVVVSPPPRARVTAGLQRYAPVALGIVLAAAAALWVWWSRPPAETGRSSAVTATPPPPTATDPTPQPEPQPPPPVAPQPLRVETTAPPPAVETPAPRRREAPPVAPPAPRDPGPAALAPEETALLTRLRAGAETARGRALAAGASQPVVARGDSALAAAESLAAEGQVARAAARLSAAAALWSSAAEQAVLAAPRESAATRIPATVDSAPAPAAPPAARPPAPIDPVREIGSVVEAYAAAIEARSLPGIRRVYPGLQPRQALDWERFFEAVSEIEVDLRITKLDVSGPTAVADLAGVYTFTDPSTRRLQRENVSFVARLRQAAGGWRIESIR